MPKKLWLFAAIGWTLLVFLLCLVSFNNLPSVKIKSADKYVHFTFHFIFTFLWFLYLKVDAKSTFQTITRIVFISVFFGVLIEIAQQFFTRSRSADIFDVFANFVGALSAAVVVCIFFNRRKLK